MLSVSKVVLDFSNINLWVYLLEHLDLYNFLRFNWVVEMKQGAKILQYRDIAIKFKAEDTGKYVGICA